jgi:hypothetical protein
MKIKKRTVPGIIVTILILIILLISFNSELSLLKPSISEIPSNYQDSEIQEPDYSISNKSIKKDLLIQTWISISEIAGTSSEPFLTTDYQITFNSDNTFTSTTFGLPEQGTYTIDKNQILLKDTNGAELQTYAEVSETELKIIYPAFPKKIIYKKI